MSLSELPIIKDSKQLFNDFICVRKDLLDIPKQEDYNYYTVEVKPRAVMVLPVTAEGKFVINREYRHPTQQVLWGCPGGVPHDEESPEQGGERELLEETGYTAESFVRIGEAFPFPGLCTQKIFYVLAWDARKEREPKLEHAELIESVELTFDELQEKIRCEPTDGLLPTALFFLSLSKKQL